MAATWGKVALTQLHGLSDAQALSCTGIIFIGAILEAPWLVVYQPSCFTENADAMGALVSLGLSLLLMVQWSSMFSIDITYWIIKSICFLIGITTCAQILSYPMIIESNPSDITPVNPFQHSHHGHWCHELTTIWLGIRPPVYTFTLLFNNCQQATYSSPLPCSSVVDYAKTPWNLWKTVLATPMIHYIVKRILLLIPTLLGILTINFFLHNACLEALLIRPLPTCKALPIAITPA